MSQFYFSFFACMHGTESNDKINGMQLSSFVWEKSIFLGALLLSSHPYPDFYILLAYMGFVSKSLMFSWKKHLGTFVITGNNDLRPAPRYSHYYHERFPFFIFSLLWCVFHRQRMWRDNTFLQEDWWKLFWRNPSLNWFPLAVTLAKPELEMEQHPLVSQRKESWLSLEYVFLQRILSARFLSVISSFMFLKWGG